MVRRISAILISIIMVLSSVLTGNAEYDQEILFNGIPWGSTYQEVTTALTEQYNVSFTEPEYEYYKPVRLFNPPKEWPFSLATGFTVYSKQTVRIADLPAYIVLHFVFPNDGENVLNEDINCACFNEASYRFWSNKEAPDASFFPEIQSQTYGEAYENAKDLAIILKSIYGESEETSANSLSAKRAGIVLYKTMGLDNSTVTLGTGDIVGRSASSIYTIYFAGDQNPGMDQSKSISILRDLVQQERLKQVEKSKQELEEKKREQEVHNNEVVANTNKNGL